jgi:large subunit ribosomal protein L4
MAAPKAPLLDVSGKRSKDVTLTEDVFGAEVRPHLIHETVRAETAAARAGTQAAKSRGLVAGGRAKPWRQKGTGRARAGTTRAPQWTGGGVAFPPQPRSYKLKVNRKARRSALRGALSDLAGRSAIALIDASGFKEPSTRAAADLVGGWGKELPLVVIVQPDEEVVAKSFRNLDRVLVLEPSELEVGA